MPDGIVGRNDHGLDAQQNEYPEKQVEEHDCEKENTEVEAPLSSLQQ